MEKYYKYIYLVLAIIFLLILRIILIKGSEKINEKEKRFLEDKIIKQPLSYKYAGIIICICSILLISLCFIFAENILATGIATVMVFIPLFLGGILTFLYEKNWKIIISNDSIIYTNILGKKVEYKLKNLKTKFYNSSYRIYKDDKCILKISFIQNNCTILLDAINKNK